LLADFLVHEFSGPDEETNEMCEPGIKEYNINMFLKFIWYQGKENTVEF